jgi:hypothetical protein
MNLATLPLEIAELIFAAVAWDQFGPEWVENLNKASECINDVQERNRRLRELRPTAKFVDHIVNRLAFKYVHITSQARAEELINAEGNLRIPGTVVRHLFLGDKLGRFHKDNAPDYHFVTAESGKAWIQGGTFWRLLKMMPNLLSLHIHLPGIHSQMFSAAVIQCTVAPLESFQSIQCLSLYDDINNSHCYTPVRSVPDARNSLSAFPNLQYLVVSESEGLPRLDRFVALVSPSHEMSKWYAPRLRKIMLEKWCPMGKDIILYNLAMEITLTDVRMSRQVPRRMSMDGKLTHFCFSFYETDHRCPYHNSTHWTDPDLPSTRLFLSFCGRSRCDKGASVPNDTRQLSESRVSYPLVSSTR